MRITQLALGWGYSFLCSEDASVGYGLERKPWANPRDAPSIDAPIVLSANTVTITELFKVSG